jgi:hypothetical protein
VLKNNDLLIINFSIIWLRTCSTKNQRPCKNSIHLMFSEFPISFNGYYLLKTIVSIFIIFDRIVTIRHTDRDGWKVFFKAILFLN